MPDLPAYTATETTFQAGPTWGPTTDPAAFDAMQQWCHDHGIDPAQVVASYPIIRKDDGIKYYRVNEAERVVAWGVPIEGGPAPWPAAIEVTR